MRQTCRLQYAFGNQASKRSRTLIPQIERKPVTTGTRSSGVTTHPSAHAGGASRRGVTVAEAPHGAFGAHARHAPVPGLGAHAQGGAGPGRQPPLAGRALHRGLPSQSPGARGPAPCSLLLVCIPAERAEAGGRGRAGPGSGRPGRRGAASVAAGARAFRGAGPVHTPTPTFPARTPRWGRVLGLAILFPLCQDVRSA